ncbi:hypothetical protein AXK61_23840 [Tsukamurella pseudospumae]|uniref:Haemophore haem-binding domain-containing protein n=2 Tax=Tsukamurella pseudospumae TaxID=239498 RepID=A0A137Z810_9ACTN|nr:hypothetical protein AXK61_23840 [Tsukamurella pseudospumae]
MNPTGLPPTGGPARGANRTVIVIVSVAAVIVVVIAAVVGLVVLNRGSGSDGAVAAPASSSSAAASSGAAIPDQYRLRGTLTSKVSVCAAGSVMSAQIPKFKDPVDYRAPDFNANLAAARAQLERLASRVSPNADAPVGPAMQEWLTAYGDFLNALSRHATGDDFKWSSGLVDSIAAKLNTMCKTV